MITKRIFSQVRLNYLKNNFHGAREVFAIKERQNIENLIQNYKIQNLSDYELLKSELSNTFRGINSTNVDSVLLKNYISLQKYDYALNFINHLKDTNETLNLGVLGKIFVLYNVLSKEKGLSNKDEKEIFGLYKTVRKKYPVLDSFTNERIISAVSLTKNWKICFDLLDEIKISCVPSASAYNDTVVATFKNGEYESGWKLLQEMLEKYRAPHEDCYASYLQNIQTNPKSCEDNLEILLNFLGNNDIVCNKNIIDTVALIFKKMNKDVSYTFISNNAECKSCKRKIPRTDISPQEFDCLKKRLFDDVIIGKDIFSRSTPMELEKFKQFLKTDKKYDVVIDGLNVAYSTGVNKPIGFIANLATSVVRHFREQNKTVLVLGRNHMLKWPKPPLRFIQQNADLFLTQNLSQDDPYFLYCALNSGLNTIIVTRDLMRNYLYLLKDIEQKKLFKRWITQAQYQLDRVLKNGKVILVPPQSYIRTCQKHDNYWHIPINMNDEISNDWLCVKV